MRVNKKTIILIVFLGILLIFIVLLKVLQSKNKSVPQTLPELITPIATIIPTVFPTHIISSTTPTSTLSCTPNENILSNLPVVTSQYSIEYLPTPEKYFVMILQNPYEEQQTQVKKWFSSRGLDPDSPCIVWTSTKGVAPKKQ